MMRIFEQKLAPPVMVRPLIERQALMAQLDEAIRRNRVVVLTAPAGWGKTTAVMQWSKHSDFPVAWYTLDASDRDPFRFLTYFLRAVAPLVPGVAAFEAQLADARLPDLAPLLQEIVQAIADAPAPFALVLEDFHTVSDAPDTALPNVAHALELVALLADYAMPCRLVLVSRTLPDLRGLVRLVSQQRAAVFHYTALQLSAGEVQQLAMLVGLSLSSDDAVSLATQHDGWVTGIVLALDRPPVAVAGLSPLHDADTSQIFAYFAEQVLAPLNEELINFLEDTSVFDDFSPARCDMLRERSDSVQLLDDVARRGFVTTRAGWLSYHSLFREFLRSRLARNPERHRRLLQRAGDIYGAEEDLERAVGCYLAAGTVESAIALLRRLVPTFRQQARQTTLIACFEQLGRTQPLPADLLLAQARTYNDLARWENAHLALDMAAAIGDAEVRWEAMAITAEILLFQSDYSAAEATLAALPFDTLPPRLKLVVLIPRARLKIVQGDTRSAVQLFEQALALTPTIQEAANDPTILAHIHDHLGRAYAHQAEWQLARRHLKRADAYWQLSGNHGRRALTLNNLANLALKDRRYDEAKKALDTGLALARQTGRRREEILLLGSLADLVLIEGDIATANRYFRDTYELALQVDVPVSVAFAAVGAYWANVLMGQMVAAQQWADYLAPLDVRDTPELYGRVLLAQSIIALQGPTPDYQALRTLAETVAPIADSLDLPEQAVLALLRVAVAYASDGWLQAKPHWGAFARYAAQLPDTLLQHIARPHQAMLAAIAHEEPLAAPLLGRPDATTQPVRWEITTLGEFVCLVDNRPCDLSPLHRTLLVRLIDAGRGGLTTDRLLESVWGDSELPLATLHQALRRLRDKVHLDITVRDGHCSIRTPLDEIAYDVQQFERVLAAPLSQETVQRLMALYGGDFLPGATQSASAWVEGRRTQLRERFLDTLERWAATLHPPD